MGQNTGILNIEKNVHVKAIKIALVVDNLWVNNHKKCKITVQITIYQNLNSGNLRMKGLNSSLELVGNDGPSTNIHNNDAHTQHKRYSYHTYVVVIFCSGVKFWWNKCDEKV